MRLFVAGMRHALARAASVVALSMICLPAHADGETASVRSAGPGLLEQMPNFRDLQAKLTPNDELAVLEALHIGLSEAPDGSTYYWHRRNGDLSGTVLPTTSFREEDGRVCRHVIFQAQLGPHLRRIEGVACRSADKSWQLNG